MGVIVSVCVPETPSSHAGMPMKRVSSAHLNHASATSKFTPYNLTGPRFQTLPWHMERTVFVKQSMLDKQEGQESQGRLLAARGEAARALATSAPQLAA